MKIALDRATVPAGQVTFVVTDQIAANADEAGKMDETGNIGETGEMDTGTSKTFTVTLSAGHYILMCNEVGHYTSGMHMAFTVN